MSIIYLIRSVEQAAVHQVLSLVKHHNRNLTHLLVTARVPPLKRNGPRVVVDALKRHKLGLGHGLGLLEHVHAPFEPQLLFLVRFPELHPRSPEHIRLLLFWEHGHRLGLVLLL